MKVLFHLFFLCCVCVCVCVCVQSLCIKRAASILYMYPPPTHKHTHIAPTITYLSSSPADVQLGLTVNITCSFTSANNPTLLEWYFNGQLDRRVPLAPGQLESVWSIKSFSASNDGVYQCRVSNENNDNSIQNLWITAAGKPTLQGDPCN